MGPPTSAFFPPARRRFSGKEFVDAAFGCPFVNRVINQSVGRSLEEIFSEKAADASRICAVAH